MSKLQKTKGMSIVSATQRQKLRKAIAIAREHYQKDKEDQQ